MEEGVKAAPQRLILLVVRPPLMVREPLAMTRIRCAAGRNGRWRVATVNQPAIRGLATTGIWSVGSGRQLRTRVPLGSVAPRDVAGAPTGSQSPLRPAAHHARLGHHARRGGAGCLWVLPLGALARHLDGDGPQEADQLARYRRHH